MKSLRALGEIMPPLLLCFPVYLFVSKEKYIFALTFERITGYGFTFKYLVWDNYLLGEGVLNRNQLRRKILPFSDMDLRDFFWSAEFFII